MGKTVGQRCLSVLLTDGGALRARFGETHQETLKRATTFIDAEVAKELEEATDLLVELLKQHCQWKDEATGNLMIDNMGDESHARAMRFLAARGLLTIQSDGDWRVIGHWAEKPPEGEGDAKPELQR